MLFKICSDAAIGKDIYNVSNFAITTLFRVKISNGSQSKDARKIPNRWLQTLDGVF